MTATIVTLCSNVADAIAAAGITASVQYNPELERDEFNTRTVLVFPGGPVVLERSDRSDEPVATRVVRVAVVRAIRADQDPGTVETLLQDVETIATALLEDATIGPSIAAITHDPMLDGDRMRLGTFYSELAVEFTP